MDAELQQFLSKESTVGTITVPTVFLCLHFFRSTITAFLITQLKLVF